MWSFSLCKRVIKTIPDSPIAICRSHRACIEYLAERYGKDALEFYNSNPLVVLYGEPTNWSRDYDTVRILSANEYVEYREKYRSPPTVKKPLPKQPSESTLQKIEEERLAAERAEEMKLWSEIVAVGVKEGIATLPAGPF